MAQDSSRSSRWICTLCKLSNSFDSVSCFLCQTLRAKSMAHTDSCSVRSMMTRSWLCGVCNVSNDCSLSVVEHCAHCHTRNPLTMDIQSECTVDDAYILQQRTKPVEAITFMNSSYRSLLLATSAICTTSSTNQKNRSNQSLLSDIYRVICVHAGKKKGTAVLKTDEYHRALFRRYLNMDFAEYVY